MGLKSGNMSSFHLYHCCLSFFIVFLRRTSTGFGMERDKPWLLRLTCYYLLQDLIDDWKAKETKRGSSKTIEPTALKWTPPKGT